jgi:hypothetical protein
VSYINSADYRAYNEARNERRRNDPEYKKARNARTRQRYAEDPEFRRGVRAYSQAYRTQGLVNLSTRAMRVSRGMIWTPEQEAEHLTKTLCEVCGKPPTKRGIFADHCHKCRWYRGPLCQGCNHALGIIEKWQAVCPEGSPMRLYMDRHVCVAAVAA